MDLWNKRDLPLPSVSSYKALTKEIDLTRFLEVCNEAKEFFTANHYFHAEYLVLSRIIYRMKQKFRSSKDFHTLEKVCKAVKSFFAINIVAILDIILQFIPSKYTKETYLPSQNLLHYLLVRFQGVSKLLEIVVNTCRDAAFLLDIRIKTGHFWKIGIIAYSISSRIYILAMHTISKICEFYKKLIPFSKKLQSTKRWLPEDYKLPSDLKDWLNINWMEFENDIQINDILPEVSDVIALFDLVDDEDVEFCEEYILVKDDEISESTTTKPLTNLRGLYSDTDFGEVINLDDSLPLTDLECNKVFSPHLSNFLDNSISKITNKKRKNKATFLDNSISKITNKKRKHNFEDKNDSTNSELIELSDSSSITYDNRHTNVFTKNKRKNKKGLIKQDQFSHNIFENFNVGRIRETKSDLSNYEQSVGSVDHTKIKRLKQNKELKLNKTLMKDKNKKHDNLKIKNHGANLKKRKKNKSTKKGKKKGNKNLHW